jgi:uncharacterized protein YhfF
MTIPSALASFWGRFEVSYGQPSSSRFYEAFHFDDNEPSANHLAELVLSGRKRATAGLVCSFEAGERALPEMHDLSIVTTWSGTPLCVIETTQVAIVRFQDVTAEFAAAEGEGDGSLEYWRRVHWEYFGRECARIGRFPDGTMPVLCEQFEVVYGADRFHRARSRSGEACR